MTETPATMTAKEAQVALGISDLDFVYRLARSGAILGWKENGRWVFDAESIRERKRRTSQRFQSKQDAQQRREARRAAARFTKEKT